MNEQKQLIDDHLNSTLDESGREELQQWLKADDDHMREFVRVLMFEEEIRDAVSAKDGEASTQLFTNVLSRPATHPSPTPSSSRPDLNPLSRFARAAAWLGVFTWFGNKAQAAGTVTSTMIMTKTATTAITAAILVTGGATVYFVHNNNRQTEERIAKLQSAPETREVPQQPSVTPVAHPAKSTGYDGDASALLGKWRKLHEVGPRDMAEATAYMNDLNAMDATALKELLLEAVRIGDLPPKLVQDILLRLAKKSPADATTIGVRLVNNATKFNRNWADYVGKAFGRWLEQDPAAAHAWYIRASESGELTPKSIPQDGMDYWSLDRRLPDIRLTALLKSNLPEAEAMMAEMRPEDVAMSVNGLDDPAQIARLIPRLPAANQTQAAIGTADGMARQNFTNAVQWIESLQIDAAARDKLVISAMAAAQESSGLDLVEIGNALPTLPIRDEALPDLLLRAATNASIVSFKGWQWDTMGERTAWLRQHLPAEKAEETVGKLLGAAASENIEKAMKIYQQETAGSSPDPHLSAEFAKGISEWGNEDAIRKALQIVETLPEGPLREETKATVEKNRH